MSRAHAAGPILIEPVTGLPVKWNSAVPVRYNLETGRLNANLNNVEAGQAIDLAFQKWTTLAGVSLNTTRGAPINFDITENNIAQFIGQADGLTPIVYDETGRITDEILGQGASQVVLGFATPEITLPNSNIIVEGFACMNGRAMEGDTLESILNLMVHELGHMLGAGHSQLNGETIFDGNAENNATIPIMYPILRSTSPDNRRVLPTPTLDDEVSMGFLYPSSTYLTRGGNMSGRVFRGASEFRGANVIVRKVGDPLFSAVSWPSGMATNTGAPWEVHLLPPGDYTIQVEPIDPTFTGGSSVGPFDPPPSGISPEFFSGVAESSDPTLDDPNVSSNLTLAAGQTITPVDVVLNETTVTLNPGAENAALIEKSGTVYQIDGTLPAFQYTVPIGTSTSALTITLTETNGQPLDLFVRNGAAVAASTGGTFVADANVTGTGASKQLLLSKGTTPALKSGTYFLALVNRGDAPANFQLQASFVSPLAASSAAGSGAGGGCHAARASDGSSDPMNLALMLAPLVCVLIWRRRIQRSA